MPTDPVTNSMLGTPPAAPPKIDVFNLDKYDDDILRQIQLDLRIKRSRIRHEIDEFEKLIFKLNRERDSQIKRSNFYREIISYIQFYFHEESQCQTHPSNTQL